MNKNEQGFGIAVALLLVFAAIITIGLFTYQRENTQETTRTNTNSQIRNVKEAADAFLISKVGPEKFAQYYSFDKEQSSYADPKDSVYDFMAYHFSPLSNISNADNVIMIQVNRENLNEVFADAVPDCDKDKSYCDFNVSRQQATEIARNNLATANVEVYWHVNYKQRPNNKGLSLVIEASGCPYTDKHIFIDYRNGLVIGTDNGCFGEDSI